MANTTRSATKKKSSSSTQETTPAETDNRTSEGLTLLQTQLQDLHSTEQQLVEALPKLIEEATNQELKQALENHQKETQEHAQRLEEIIKNCGGQNDASVCRGIQGIIKEGQKHVKMQPTPELKDAVIIASAQKCEHYEICGYGTAAALAETLGLSEQAQLLRRTLEEEYQADRTLSQIAEGAVNAEATGSEQESPAPRGGKRFAFGVTGSRRNKETQMPRDDYENRGGRGSSRYNDENDDRNRGWYDGRSQGGERSSQMQDRDEYGQFAGYGNDPYRSRENQGYESQQGGSYGQYGSRGNSGSSRYDENDDRGGRGGRGFEDYRSRGGERSSQSQGRDSNGQFTGNGNSNYGNSGYGNSGYGMQDYGNAQRDRSRSSNDGDYRGGSSRYSNEDDNRGGNSDYGYSSNSRSRSSGYNNDDDRSSSRGYTDSAGRHYTRESWERAQEGRVRGGQHSHGGSR